MCKFRLILCVKDVNIDTDALGLLSPHHVKDMVDKSRLAQTARGDKRHITLIVQVTHQLRRLLFTIAEIFRTFVTILHKGVVQSSCHKHFILYAAQVTKYFAIYQKKTDFSLISSLLRTHRQTIVSNSANNCQQFG